jgi:hypothetical protein
MRMTVSFNKQLIHSSVQMLVQSGVMRCSFSDYRGFNNA